jgi:hypothetical protein
VIPLLVTGESHVGPIRRGLDLVPEPDRGQFVFWPLGSGGALRQPCHSYDATGHTLTITSPKWQARVYSRETIGSVGAGTIVFLSMPLNTSRILRDYAWDQFAPGPVARHETPLSEKMVDSLIDMDSTHAVRLAQDLSEIWPNMVVVEAPRFFANATYLGKHRFEICQYVDAAYRKRVRGQLSASGIAILDQPPSTVTEAGTTDLRYDNENPLDNHHANAAYGKLVLEQMTDYAASR